MNSQTFQKCKINILFFIHLDIFHLLFGQLSSGNLVAPRQFLAAQVLGSYSSNLRLVIFNFISKVDILSISCEITLRWMPHDCTDILSTLVQVMAWCHLATSHHLNQWWPSFMTSYGVARPQCVKLIYNNQDFIVSIQLRTHWSYITSSTALKNSCCWIWYEWHEITTVRDSIKLMWPKSKLESHVDIVCWPDK